MNNTSIRNAIRFALLANVVVAGTVYAQTPDESIQEVVVTGSRIRSPNMTSISPVTSISNEDIAVTGKIRVEDIINQLPQALAAQGSSISNGATGTATVDLRGLSAKRTLVLINGRRLMPGTPSSTPAGSTGAADLNQIPGALIERVEVLTGGASSVYGADAIGGVVNFIMNTRFEGVKVEANYSFNQHENDNPVADIVRERGYELPESSVTSAYSRDISFVAGSNFADDRGNATFYLGYRDIDSVLQGEYDYSACTFNSGDAFTCGGSGTTNPTRMRVRNPATGALAGNVIIDAGTGELRPYNSSLDTYNFGPLNFFQRPDERYTGGMFLDLDLGEHQNLYSEFMFMKDTSIAQLAPSGSFGQEFTVPCSNPLFTASERQQFCTQYGLSTAPDSIDTTSVVVGRRNVEGGGRQNELVHQAFRAVVGLRGELSEAWSYDAYGQVGETQLNSTTTADFSVTRLGRAFDVVPDANGNAVCRSVLDGSDPLCVPYNVWQLGGVTKEQTDYLQVPLKLDGQTAERIVNASVTGNFGSYGVKSPAANTGLIVNTGVEWRQELTEVNPDLAVQTGDGAGSGGATTPIGGGYESRDVFAEARMALVEDRALAQSLAVEAGYRYSDYDLGFSSDTYKFGTEWSPVDGLRARASFQRSVRVPNIAELFGAQGVGLAGTIDVCSGVNPTLTFEQCARTGVTQAQYGAIDANPANQYNGFLGGNQDLQPELADTLSFGLAFQPSFLPNLRLQIDYFDITIEDAIQNPNADFSLLLCALNGDPTICSRIQRDQDGSLFQSANGFVVDTVENIGEIGTSGIDLDVSYRFDVGAAGRLDVDLIGTWIKSLEVTPQPGVKYDCAGLYGSICGVPAPEWRHKLDATWRAPWSAAGVTLSWRYTDAVGRDAENDNEFLAFLGGVTGVLPTDSTLGSRSYIDLTGTVSFADRYTLRLGVNNLFDKDPPLNGGASCPAGPCNGNTWPQAYDALGRQIFGLVTIDF